MTWTNWFKGLSVAVAGAALPAAAQMLVNRQQNKSASAPVTGGNVGLTAGVSGLVAFIAYLAQSPLPNVDVNGTQKQ